MTSTPISDAEVEAAARNYDSSASMYSRLREGFTAGARWAIERSASVRPPSAATGWKMVRELTETLRVFANYSPDSVERSNISDDRRVSILDPIYQTALGTFTFGDLRKARRAVDASDDMVRDAMLAASPTPPGSGAQVEALVKAAQQVIADYPAAPGSIKGWSNIKLLENAIAALNLTPGSKS